MSENMEPLLRNALDAVNVGRKWTMLGVAALFFAVVIILAVLFALFPAMQQGVTVNYPAGATQTVTPSTLMPLKVLYVSSAAELLFIACGTIAVMLYISRMTRIILRAIESTRR